CVRPGPVRRAYRHRSRGGVHHLGGDTRRRRGPGRGVPPGRRARSRGGAAARNRQEMCALVEDLARRGRRSRLPRCHAARCPGPAGMESHAHGGRVTPLESPSVSAPGSYVWGPLSGLGLSAALVTALLDQASKFWVLYVYDLKAKGALHVAPFLDFVLTWNKGIS